MYATSLIMVLGTPVLAITIVLRGARARLPYRASSIRRWVVTRCCSSTYSGFIRILPCTS